MGAGAGKNGGKASKKYAELPAPPPPAGGAGAADTKILVRSFTGEESIGYSDIHGGKAGLRKDTAIKAHQAQCTDSDFRKFNHIREAYPFDYDKKKKIRKSDQVEGLGHKKNWGNVTITDRGITEIVCQACGVLVTDRQHDNGLEERQATPFMVCLRCKGHGRRVEICISCYEKGAMSSTAELELKQEQAEMDRQANMAHQKARALLRRAGSDTEMSATEEREWRRRALCGGREDQATVLKVPVPEKATQAPSRLMKVEDLRNNKNRRNGSLRGRSPIPSASPQSGSPRVDPGQPSYTSPRGPPVQTLANKCGMWSGKFTEGKMPRAETREFFFAVNGTLTGSSPEGAGIAGSWNGKDAGKISWTEKHPWGTVKVNGQYMMNQIQARFEASDGGRGDVVLNFE
eukprot:TRINITY_DN125189_c0_g1_i1.p1 TRINITY_DN125189_c0_g1~~TRINITY_DN125189_c0_g1_i1.p1  ORF type:complete len:403 (-),score=79.06 TRINITY_DN125189_c0_g1_i1:169-1377(-)